MVSTHFGKYSSNWISFAGYRSKKYLWEEPLRMRSRYFFGHPIQSCLETSHVSVYFSVHFKHPCFELGSIPPAKKTHQGHFGGRHPFCHVDPFIIKSLPVLESSKFSKNPSPKKIQRLARQITIDFFWHKEGWSMFNTTQPNRGARFHRPQISICHVDPVQPHPR